MFVVLTGNHERDWPNTGDRFYPLVNAKDSGGERRCLLHLQSYSLQGQGLLLL